MRFHQHTATIGQESVARTAYSSSGTVSAVSYDDYRSASEPGTYWAGEAHFQAPGASSWQTLDLPTMSHTGSRFTDDDVAVGQPVTAHGDGAADLYLGIGCQKEIVRTDKLEFGAPTAVTTSDLEAATTSTAGSTTRRIAAGETTILPTQVLRGDNLDYLTVGSVNLEQLATPDVGTVGTYPLSEVPTSFSTPFTVSPDRQVGSASVLPGGSYRMKVKPPTTGRQTFYGSHPKTRGNLPRGSSAFTVAVR